MVLYTALVSPFRLAFSDDYEVDGWSKFFGIFELVVDLIFSLDILINFVTGYERFNGSIEIRPKKIAIRYLATFFFIDVLATFPFELVVSLINGSQKDNSV